MQLFPNFSNEHNTAFPFPPLMHLLTSSIWEPVTGPPCPQGYRFANICVYWAWYLSQNHISLKVRYNIKGWSRPLIALWSWLCQFVTEPSRNMDDNTATGIMTGMDTRCRYVTWIQALWWDVYIHCLLTLSQPTSNWHVLPNQCFTISHMICLIWSLDTSDFPD